MSLRPNPWDERPRVAESAYVDPAAEVIGKVLIGEEVFVAPGAVIRADEPGSSIVIGERSNVQDGVVIHALGGSAVTIGRETSLAHGCVVHGPCTIGDGCFVGFGSVVFNAVLGDGVVVEHLAVVEGTGIEPGKVVSSGSRLCGGRKGHELEAVDGERAQFAGRVVAANLQLSKGYRDKNRRGSQRGRIGGGGSAASKRR